MDIVYNINNEAQGAAVFAERSLAEEVAQIWQALRSATTWGEFKAAMPRVEYERLVESLELEDEVDPNAIFNASIVPGYDDGDYPTWLQAEALHWFPEELIDQYGGASSSTLNGPYLYLPAERADEIAEALRAARPDWTVTRTKLWLM